jgi:hypothetical protein
MPTVVMNSNRLVQVLTQSTDILDYCWQLNMQFVLPEAGDTGAKIQVHTHHLSAVRECILHGYIL